MSLRLRLSLLLLLCVPGLIHAQGYTFERVDLESESGHFLQLSSLSNDGALTARDSRPGGLSYRATLAPLAIDAVLCPPEAFVRAPNDSRGGPDVAAQNAAHGVVGSDTGSFGGQPTSYGFAQTEDGTCTFFLHPDSIGTVFTAVNADGTRLGYYWIDPSLESGLLRFHAFAQAPDGTLTPLVGTLPNDLVWPTGLNDAGDAVGYLFEDVQPDNTYMYQAFVRLGGVFTRLDGPQGEDLWLTGLNNQGKVIGIVGSVGVLGGAGVVYDTLTETFTAFDPPPPSLGFHSTSLLLTAINDAGKILGITTEEQDGCGESHDVPACSTVFHGFLATPVPAPIPTAPVPMPPRKEVKARPRHKHHQRHHWDHRLYLSTHVLQAGDKDTEEQ